MMAMKCGGLVFLRLLRELVGDEAELMPWERLARFAEHCEENDSEAERLKVSAFRAKQHVIDSAEFHLAGVLVEASENLREERGDNVAFHVVGKLVRNDEALLQSNDCSGDLGKLDGVFDDLGRRPVLLFGLAEDLADRGWNFGRFGRLGRG